MALTPVRVLKRTAGSTGHATELALEAEELYAAEPLIQSSGHRLPAIVEVQVMVREHPRKQVFVVLVDRKVVCREASTEEPMRIATNRSLKSRLLEGLAACYCMPVVYGFPWIVVESWITACLLLVPILVWGWRDSKPVEPEIRF